MHCDSNATAKGDGGGASGCSQQDMELSKVSCPGTCVCRADAVRDTQTVKHGIYGILSLCFEASSNGTDEQACQLGGAGGNRTQSYRTQLFAIILFVRAVITTRKSHMQQALGVFSLMEAGEAAWREGLTEEELQQYIQHTERSSELCAWDMMHCWRKCNVWLHTLMHRPKRAHYGVHIGLHMLAHVEADEQDSTGVNLEWTTNCEHMKSLPVTLCMYLQKLFHRWHNWVPAPKDDSASSKLTADQCNRLWHELVEETGGRGGNSGCHLEIYSTAYIMRGGTGDPVRLRAFPFAHIPFRGKQRLPFISFRADWMLQAHGISQEAFQASRDWQHAGYGRVLLFFKAKLRPTKHAPSRERELAFIEEFFPLDKSKWRGVDAATYIASKEHGCMHLYSGKPRDRIYSIIQVQHILGPAHITRDPVHPTVPSEMLRKQHVKKLRGIGEGSELYVLDMLSTVRGSMWPGVSWADSSRYFESKEAAVAYVARMCGLLTIFKLYLSNARANCSHLSSGKGAEAKGVEYTSVVEHGGIVMQCAIGSTYPGGPAQSSLLIGLNCYEILTNQTEQDLKAAWQKWAVRDPEAYKKAFADVRKPFTKGQGVLYRIRYSINLEGYRLYVVPKGSGVPVLCQGGRLYQERAGELCEVTAGGVVCSPRV